MKNMKKKKKKVSEKEEEEEEDVKVKGNKHGRKGKGKVVISKGKKIKKKTKGGKKGKGPSKPTKKVLSYNQIRREKFLSEYPPLFSRTVPSSFFHAIRDAKVNMKRFMEDIGFSAFHSVNIVTFTNRIHEILGLPIGGISLYDLPERREDDEFLQLWLSQFALKKKKQIFATDIAEKLVRSTRVDFMFKVNFLMLFANVMGKADTMRAFVNILVVRRIREDTNIAGVDWCDFIHRCLAISHEPNTDSGFYNGPLNLTIEDEDFWKNLSFMEMNGIETVEAEGFCDMLQFCLIDNKERLMLKSLERCKQRVSNDDNVMQLFEKYKGFFKEMVLPEKRSQKAPQNVSKAAAVNTKEAELAEKPKEPAGDDYQVVRAATVMKAEDREEFEVETFTQWIEGNIDWVGKDEFHDWPRVVEPF
ncbi:hypothetical protein Tco_0132874 [Tanacetum coccineum]